MTLDLEGALARLGTAGVEWCWTGSAARAQLGARSVRSRPEVLACSTVDGLAALLPEATRRSDESLWTDALVVRAAPGGLERALRARGVRVDAVGIEPGGRVVDPLGGVAALRAGDLSYTLSGDEASDAAIGLRILAVASELATAPSAGLIAAVADSAGLALRVKPPLVFDLLDRLLLGRRPAEALDLVERTRLLGLLLPEVASLVDLHRSSRYPHKDVWEHTRIVVRQAIPRADIRWGALLHDIGKPWTRTFEAPRTVHFLQHDELGANMLPGVAARLEFPPALAAQVQRLVLFHLRANLYLPTWTDAAIRRFAAEIGDTFEALLHLSRADVTSKRVGRRREAIANLHHLRTRVAEIEQADAARAPCVPKGLGAEIIRRLGIPAGPQIGVLRRACEDAVRRGELPNDADVDVYIAFLRQRAA